MAASPINEDEFRRSFKGEILMEKDNEYKQRLSRFWSQTTVDQTGRPRFIVCPRNRDDVCLALRFSRNDELKRDGLAIISGGHWVGRNCGRGILMDMNKNMRNVEVIDCERSKTGKALRIEGGAIWEEVDRVAIKQGLATPSANYACKGVVGSGLVGGYGYLCGEHGLTVENVVEMEIVLADGKSRVINDDREKELFWACRGAAPALGCVVSVTLQAHKQESKVFLAALMYPRSKAGELAEALKAWHENCSEKEAVLLAIHQAPGTNEPCLTAHCFYNSNDSNVDQSLKRFERLVKAGPSKTEKGVRPFEDCNKILERYMPRDRRDQRVVQVGAVVTKGHITVLEDVMSSFEEMVKRNKDFQDSMILFPLYPDARSRSRRDDNDAFGGRFGLHNVDIILQYRENKHDHEAKQIAQHLIKLFPRVDDPRYAGHESDLSGNEALGENYRRVAQIKRRYDPENIFNKWIRIEPERQ